MSSENNLLDDFFIQETENPNTQTTHLWENDEITKARERDRIGRRIRVLITVKTFPRFSTKYSETVCVAGIALDPARWVRLYPIPFRYLAKTDQFKKYDIIEINVSQPKKDWRIESLHVDIGSIEIISSLGSNNGWARRAQYVEPMRQTPLCVLREQIAEDLNGPSLGLVRPAPGTFRLEITDFPGWTPEEHARRDEILKSQDIALNESLQRTLIPLLKEPRFNIHACFKCESPNCNGHRIGLIDWEATALQYREKGSDEDVARIIRERFERNPTSPSKDLRIFVGNQNTAPKRRNFEALGLYYPSKDAAASVRNVLF